MATENTTASGATPQAGDAASTQTQAVNTTTPDPQAGEGGNSEAISLEEARKLRSESQNLRKRLKSYEDAEAAAQQAALTEVEKANKRIQDADAKIKQYQQELVLARVTNAAHLKGIIDPELAALAIQSKLEYDEDGMPSNLDKVLDELLKNKPYLAKPVEAASNANPAQSFARPTPQVPPMNPGRSTIQQPSSLPPGRIPSLNDIYRKQV